MTAPLVDRFGRRVDYVRISVTDRCDFRCVYCMAEEMTFVPRREILSLEEIVAVASAFTRLGVKKIRLTGGEPLVRNGILTLAERLARLEGLEELVMTTNGSRLDKLAEPLKQAGVRRVNISLDSLKPGRFKELTRTGSLDDVLRGIAAAKAAKFARIKLNAVIMRGRNDDEVLDLVRFALDNGLDLSFIEEMPLGHIEEHKRSEVFVSSAELREMITAVFPLMATTDNTGGPSRYWRVAGSECRIGFISPHSHNFCHLCNRVRVTAEGRLLLCLGNEHSCDLKAVLRDPLQGAQVLDAVITQAMDLKPERHHFSHTDEPDIVRFMNMTGG
ncbi:MAG: GTP 3',8-cyclase MoaA [Hahellaceae bacterium]|nr:GTP 3',8-cyclase MoaA [Hahellaceae bacterium]